MAQHVGIDVGGQDADVPVAQLPAALEQHHRDRIRLLAGRAAGRPDADAARSALARSSAGKQLLAQELEMVPLAEEGGQIGGDGVAELLQLLGIAVLQLLQVVAEARQPQRAQTPAQPPVDQLALGIRPARCRCAAAPGGARAGSRRRRTRIRAAARLRAGRPYVDFRTLRIRPGAPPRACRSAP